MVHTERDAEHGEVSNELLELFEALEKQAQDRGFAHLNELQDVLIYEGVMPNE